MDQALTLEIMLSGENVLLTGAAGSGKTYVLNEFIRAAKKAKKHVAVTATTGLAATHLGGNTIHSWSGIGVHDELPKHFFDNLLKGRMDTIGLTDVLIIDEVSMLHDYRLDMINEVAKEVRKDDRPFGGMQVILCGDFFQLPPVNRGDSRNGGFVVNADVWDELNPVICYLQEQHRQDDETFLDILNALRAGDIRRRHAEALLARIEVADHTNEMTELHTVNVDVDQINAARLEAIQTEGYAYSMETSGKENYVETLKRSCLAPETLVLKKGAFVMCIKNSPDKKYVNGSLGVVKDFERATHYPIVELKNGKTLTMSPDTWELRDGDKKRASISQIPLRLAWAITVHKSQGMTLDAARIDLRKAFVEGMGYVALSRVGRLENLHLIGINNMALKVSGDALAVDGSLRAKSALDQKRFEHLRKAAMKRSKKREKNPVTSDWSEKLSKMREAYPNAYRPWKIEDDEALKALFSSQTNINDISKQLGRHPGSITMRLQKHFGEDAAVS